jgi:hypothetical protein
MNYDHDLYGVNVLWQRDKYGVDFILSWKSDK